MSQKTLLFLVFAILLSTSNIHAVGTVVYPEKIVQQETSAAKQQKKVFLKRLSEKVIFKKAYKIAKRMGLVSTECATLFLKNGTTKQVIIKQESDTQITYQSCEIQGGIAFVIEKSDLNKIQYADGKEVLFAKNQQVARYIETEEDLGGAWISGFLLGWFLTFIGIAIILIAFKGLRRRKMLKGALVGTLIAVVLALIMLYLFLRLIS